ncbi:uncharacterized protein LOC126235175 [Schistocerca nitens]|uniref:uncharacterized protein LOC126213543 n=1 Tax=Schistocerca nitens TaxID=7011 RepID=UPI002117CF4F|nr:uncharacterized protein LOC126213543 [Schistocerca nitens]XP_049799866.1 uncharacterized protein LOC126235175 [Schistocerca nitens]
MSQLSNAEAANCVKNSAVGSSAIDCGIQSKVEMEDKATETCNFFSDIVHELKRKLKCVCEKLRRREKKVCSMDDIISSLKENGHLPKKLHNFLNHQKGTQVELVCNLVNNSLSSKGNRYTTNVKMFVMTVYFYSPAACDYLQKLMPLPHKSLISKWVASVDCEPGFLKDFFKYIDLNQIVRDQFSDSCLIVDSMAIRKQVVWDRGTKQYTVFF